MATLTWKLIERLSGYVEAKHPEDKDDVETEAFVDKIKREAEDLKRPLDLRFCLFKYPIATKWHCSGYFV